MEYEKENSACTDRARTRALRPRAIHSVGRRWTRRAATSRLHVDSVIAR